MKTAVSLCFSVVLVAFAASACDSSTAPDAGRTVAISATAAQNGAGSGQLASAADVVVTDGTHTLTLTRVAIVLSEIEMERVEETDCADGLDEDDCEEFELGPIVLELALGGSVEQFVSAVVPAGSYDELEFEIDVPDEDDGEQAFVDQNPEFAGVSLRVEGTWDGEAFLFEQDIDEEQELDLSPPLVVEGEGVPMNLTLFVDVATWFVFPDGSLVDPRTAVDGQPNANLVEENIRRSIEVFEDDDQDGDRDDS